MTTKEPLTKEETTFIRNYALVSVTEASVVEPNSAARQQIVDLCYIGPSKVEQCPVGQSVEMILHQKKLFKSLLNIWLQDFRKLLQ